MARLLGEGLRRLNQPALIGEILAGVILGPSLLNVVRPNEALSGISELAVFLIVVSAGLEMKFEEVAATIKKGGWPTIAMGFACPFLLGLMLGLAFGYGVTRSIFIGLCISITALPVAIRILNSFGILNSRIGKSAIATAITNDVIALLVLAVILQMPEQASFLDAAGTILWGVGKLLIFVGIVLAANYFLRAAHARGVPVSWVPEKLLSIFGNEALFGIVLVFVLLFSSMSEFLGSHFVIGAFFGALMLEGNILTEQRQVDFQKSLRSVTEGFLAPVFFAFLGLEFEISALAHWVFVLMLLIVAMTGKMAAGFFAGKFNGMSTFEAIGLGIILNGQGVMELVVANIALQHGYIGPGLFSTLVLMGVMTTVITPIFFQRGIFPLLAQEMPQQYPIRGEPS